METRFWAVLPKVPVNWVIGLVYVRENECRRLLKASPSRYGLYNVRTRRIFFDVYCSLRFISLECMRRPHVYVCTPRTQVSTFKYFRGEKGMLLVVAGTGASWVGLQVLLNG